MISLLTTSTIAQNFQEITGTPFQTVHHSFISFADIDNDNDQDVLITGGNTSNQNTAKLYTNDGNGNYTLVTGTPFSGVYHGSLAFSDIDNDNDLDVLITGGLSQFQHQPSSKLYINDGLGNYTLESGTPFTGVTQGCIAFSDIDNDNDQDVLIIGSNSSYQKIANLYINDGNGNYTLEAGTPFVPVYDGTISFLDIDNDNDDDVLITGTNGLSQHITNLYTNDGTGKYTLKIGTPFDGVRYSSVDFADIDNDNDQDLLITGQNNSSIKTSKLYTNDGNGNYTLSTGTPFNGVWFSSIAFSDIDNDNDQDVLITGGDSTQYISNLYLNDSLGNFTLIGTPFDEISNGSVAFADIDNDNYQDLIITGTGLTQMITKLYLNKGPFICNVSSSYTFFNNGNGNYSFTNTSTGDFNQSHWAFGNGSTSTSTNSNHTFSTNGAFVVALTVNDSLFGGGSCIDFSLDSFLVTGIPNPLQCVAGFIMYPDTSVLGDVVIVNSSSGTNLTYLWDFGEGSTSTLQNPSHTYTTAGPFYLCLSINDGNGCTDMYCDSIGKNGVVFNKSSGFSINVISTPIITALDNHPELNSDINIYPNPTSNQLSINTELDISEIKIIDITSKTIMSSKENTSIINVSNLADGIYFIQLITEERTITKKFVKQ